MWRKTRLAALCAALVLAAVAVAAASAYSTPAPANFWKKNYRLDVTLTDVQDPTFDATLNDVAGSVPRQARYYLQEMLSDGSFEIDASNARCFEVTTDADGNETTQSAACSDVVAALDSAPDGLDASMLGKPTQDENGELAFKAKKLVVWL
ncbi:MAG TPA: hypothetical protein VF002_09350 [Gaiellaceae bacterium]